MAGFLGEVVRIGGGIVPCALDRTAGEVVVDAETVDDAETVQVGGQRYRAREWAGTDGRRYRVIRLPRDVLRRESGATPQSIPARAG